MSYHDTPQAKEAIDNSIVDTTCFLAPNVKLNAAASPMSTTEKHGKLCQLAKALNIKSDSATKSNGLSASYLDFKKILLPSMLMSINSIANKNIPPISITANDSDQADFYNSMNEFEPLSESNDQSRSDLFKSAMLLLPTDSQWYLLNQLRIQSGSPERSDEGIEKLLQYYACLNAIEKRFPFDTKQVTSQFQWKDAFNGEVTSSDCIHYEKAAILYNAASIMAQLGTSQRLWTIDGKKLAASYFQKAATVFGFIRDSIQARIKTRITPSSDISQINLSIMMDLMLAQATECVYEKANNDKVSSPVTSMIAAQTADFYEVAHKHVITDTTKSKFSSLWVTQMKVKAAMFTAIAHFHAPLALSADMNVGERITRLVLAEENISKAVEMAVKVGGSLLDSVKAHHTVIQLALNMAKHANYEKHHQSEIDVRMLAALKRPQKSVLSPPTMAAILGDTSRFPDIFNSIVTPNHNDEIKKFMNEYEMILGSGRNNLSRYLQEIDNCLAITEQTKHAYVADGQEFHGDLLTRGNNISQKIQVYKNEEELISSEHIIQSIISLYTQAQLNIKNSIIILDSIETGKCNAAKLGELTALRAIVQILTERILTGHVKQGLLQSAYKEDVLKFSPTGWSHDKLKALLPNVFEPKKNANGTFQILEMTIKEQELVVGKMKELKKEVMKQSEELKKYGSRAELLMSKKSHDISITMDAKREKLRTIHEFDHSTKAEVAFLKERLIELALALGNASSVHSEYLNSVKIIGSFEKSLTDYIRFREHGLVELNLCVCINQESEILQEKALHLKGDGSSSFFTPNSVTAAPHNQFFGNKTKLSQIIPTFAPTIPQNLKKMPADSKTFEAYNMLASNNMIPNTFSTDDFMMDIKEREEYELEKIMMKRKITELKMNQLQQTHKLKMLSNAYESELASAPLESFMNLSDIPPFHLKGYSSRRSDNKLGVQSAIIAENSEIPAHEKLRRGFMTMIGFGDSDKAHKPPVVPFQPRFAGFASETSMGSAVNFDDLNTPHRLSRKAPKPRKMYEDSEDDEFVMEDMIAKRHNELLQENQKLKLAVQKINRDKQNSVEVFEAMKNQTDRITTLQDRIDYLEKKKVSKGSKRSVSMGSGSESKSELVEWVEEQVIRAKNTPSESNPRMHGDKLKKSLLEKQFAGVAELRRESVALDDILRMDSGIGKSKAALGEDLTPSEIIRQEKKKSRKGHSSDKHLDEISLKDTLAQMKRENDIIVKQIGSEQPLNSLPKRRVR